jgi:hypothetical protein
MPHAAWRQRRPLLVIVSLECHDAVVAAKETGEERVILFNYSGHGFSTSPPTTIT